MRGGVLLGYVASALGRCPCVADPIKGAGVRFNAYVKAEGPRGRLVLHAVNYNVPLVGEIRDGSVIPVEDLALRLKVPEGWEIQHVQAIEPGVAPQALTFAAEGGFLKTVLPTITFYKMVAVSALAR